MNQTPKITDEIAIAYSTESLIEKLEQHQLKPHTIFAKLSTNRAKLALLQKKTSR
jgi:hypothetical protein